MNTKSIIRKLGGTDKAAEAFGIKPKLVWEWNRNGIPWKHHAKIARLTGLSPEDIAASRPDSKSEAA